MKWIIIVSVLIMSTIYACTPTKEANGTTTISQQLEGSWTMYKEICCGRKNQERTGQDIKAPKRLVFSANNQVVITDLKTKISKTTTYDIETENREESMTITYINMGGISKGVFKLEDNELIIDYGYMDLQKEFYKKDE